MADLTTLNVRPDTWRAVNQLKDPGDTVDDVIQELLESHGRGEGGGAAE